MTARIASALPPTTEAVTQLADAAEGVTEAHVAKTVRESLQRFGDTSHAPETIERALRVHHARRGRIVGRLKGS